MTEVFLCEKGQLTDPSKHALRKAGIVVVEVEDPSKCQFIRATELVSTDDMLYAALDALRCQKGDKTMSADAQREQFTINVANILSAARGARP